ncbi:MAG: hypothetical protein ABJE66_36385 [Deltaproteobacteria bacterium]
MHRAVVLLVASACAGSTAQGPAWPKQHVSENDGGESLAPHQSSQVAEIGVTKNDDDEGKPAAKTPTANPATVTVDAITPAVTPPTQTPSDDPVNTEEIIIEIDD